MIDPVFPGAGYAAQTLFLVTLSPSCQRPVAALATISLRPDVARKARQGHQGENFFIFAKNCFLLIAHWAVAGAVLPKRKAPAKPGPF
jgi:hypothetical protein